MRGFFLRWACVSAALFLLLGPATGAAAAAKGRPFIAPVDAEIVRRFEQPSNKFGPGHRGTDYGLPSGTTVRASGEGTVSFAGPVAADGLFITIQHLGGISTTYSYLSRVDVRQGDRITQGQVIGLSGGGHPGGLPGLHFGAKRNGEYIDPEVLLKDFDDVSGLLQLTPFGAKATASLNAAFSHTENADSALKASNREEPQPPRGSGSAGLRRSPRIFPPVTLPNGRVIETTALPGVDPENLKKAAVERALVPKAVSLRTNPLCDPRFEGAPQQLLLEAPPGRELSTAERDERNRMRLSQSIDELENYKRSAAGKDEILRHRKKKFVESRFNPLAGVSRFDWEAPIERKLRTAKALRDRLCWVANNRQNRLGTGDVYLLDFDLNFAGGDGRAVVALGDPAVAEHVGVLVPGINNAAGTIRGSLSDAAVLRSTVEGFDKDQASRTSTIVWMGYDNPNGLQDGVGRGEAREAAPALKSFIDQLRANRYESVKRPHITVFGHSYGSTVTGKAGLLGMKADDIVFLGSPGVGKSFVDAGDFPQKRVWSALTQWDPISLATLVPVLGTNPADPFNKFGARTVRMGWNQVGHSAYFTRGARGTLNLAKILVGRSDELD